MAAAVSPSNKLPVAPITIGILAVLAMAGGLVYLSHPPPARQNESASPEAKTYVSHLRLSEVTMQAADNFVGQRLVEVQGKISNGGPRALKSVDIYCLFYSIEGREIHRERLPILEGSSKPLQPDETRDFRLPFDALPNGWNQAVPRMVIAKITFAP